MITLKLEIVNQKGLHARASAKFVETVERFDATAQVTHEGETVSGDSIMGLLMLAAAQGCVIDVTVEGADENALAEALIQIVADKFGEGK